MKFSEVVAQTLAWLQREGRVSYRALKREFDLDDEFLEDVKAEIIEVKRLAMDENGKVLVWTGDTTVASSSWSPTPQTMDSGLRTPDSKSKTLDLRQDAGERRQLTVMFCDLVGSPALSEHLDPEELREVVRAYQQTSAAVIERYAGHIAQYLGDGLLVYFGYPVAHEDDAQRAVRAGLEIVADLHLAVPRQSTRADGWPVRPATSPHWHTHGPVVVGEMGGGEGANSWRWETPRISPPDSKDSQSPTGTDQCGHPTTGGRLVRVPGPGAPVAQGHLHPTVGVSGRRGECGAEPL